MPRFARVWAAAWAATASAMDSLKGRAGLRVISDRRVIIPIAYNNRHGIWWFKGLQHQEIGATPAWAPTEPESTQTCRYRVVDIMTSKILSTMRARLGIQSGSMYRVYVGGYDSNGSRCYFKYCIPNDISRPAYIPIKRYCETIGLYFRFPLFSLKAPYRLRVVDSKHTAGHLPRRARRLA